jgi:hypothetical protein
VVQRGVIAEVIFVRNERNGKALIGTELECRLNATKATTDDYDILFCH